jgi:hypothetical protein
MTNPGKSVLATQRRLSYNPGLGENTRMLRKRIGREKMRGPFCVASATLALVVCLQSVVTAESIDYTSQFRGVLASASATDPTGSGNEADLNSAPDFAPFISSVGADVLLPFAFAHADAFQLSSLDETSINAIGTAAVAFSFADGADPIFDTIMVDGMASTSFNVEFQIEESIGYQLMAELTVLQGSGSTLADVELIGPSGTVFSFEQLVDGSESYDVFGTLEPGAYTYTATALINPEQDNGVNARATFVTQLIIPEPGTITLLLAGLLSITRRRR